MPDQSQMNFAELSPEQGLLFLSLETPRPTDEESQFWRETWRHELTQKIYFMERRLARLKDINGRF